MKTRKDYALPDDKRGLAKYQSCSLTITITAYGRRCILSAHKRRVGVFCNDLLDHKSRRKT